jgi:hypothetical protein
MTVTFTRAFSTTRYAKPTVEQCNGPQPAPAGSEIRTAQKPARDRSINLEG